jgi:hypothetical protein
MEREERTEDDRWKCDDSMKSFVFTLKNPHNIRASTFVFKAEMKQRIIFCHSSPGPAFGDMFVYDNCHANVGSFIQLGHVELQ